MWPFKRVPKPSPLRLVDLDNRLSEVETAVAWLRKANVDVNARLTTVQRKSAAPATENDTPQRGTSDVLGGEAPTDPRLRADSIERRRRLRGF